MDTQRNIYLSKLIACKNNGLVKVITGTHQCGKTYLLFRLFRDHLRSEQVPDDHVIEMAFNLRENEKYRDPDVFFTYVTERICDEKQYYVLLDEVWLLGDFELILNSLMRRRNIDIYVTGSNAERLNRNIITEFRGRSYRIHVH